MDKKILLKYIKYVEEYPDDHEVGNYPVCLNEWYDNENQERKEITIPLSEEDLEELKKGETFDWIFDGVDVHLKLEEEQC